MPNPSVKLLLSCVSGEFGEHRDALRHALTRPNVEVKIQEDFKALGGDTLSMLEEYIVHCDAVVHFVGDMAGSTPAASSVDDLLRRRPKLEARLAEKGLGRDALKSLTYTQWEAWLAIGLDKRLPIVQPAEGVARGPDYSRSDASRAAQAQHLDRLRSIVRYPGPPFTSADNLVAQIFGSAVFDALAKAGAQPPSVDMLRPGLAEALERDFQRRYAQATQRSIFPELLKTDLLRNLAMEVLRDIVAQRPTAGGAEKDGATQVRRRRRGSPLAWRVGLDSDPVRTLYRWAMTFAAPELVPRSSLRGLDAEVAAGAIEAVSKVEDPFTLVGAFEICADRAAQDERFVCLGDRLLYSLFGDMQRLTGACALFGAIFVITTAHFATHETLQRRPVFWRRRRRYCARVSSCSRARRKWHRSERDDIVGDASFWRRILSFGCVGFRGRAAMAARMDFPEDSRRRPIGRAVGARRQLSQQSAPPSWNERLDKAYAWIVAENIGTFAQYPSVLQGTRRAQPTLAEFQSVPQGADALLALANDPTANTLLSVSPFIETFGFPNEFTDDAEKVLASIRSAPPDEDDKIALFALSVLAHIAILTENAALAEGISELCLEKARCAETHRSIFELVCRLVECTAAMKDRAEAARTLARRVELLAFIVPASGRRGSRIRHRNARTHSA